MKPVPPFVPFGEEGTEAPSLDRARAAVLPLPYECAVSYGTGTGQGPFHILDASREMETFDEELLVDWTRMGVFTFAPPDLPPNPEKALPIIQSLAENVLDAGKPFVGIGGDHAVTIGLVRAAAEAFPNLSVLQIDAHLDLRETWNGSRFNHACVMRRIADDVGLPFRQAGIRSFSKEEWELVRERGYKPFLAHEIAGRGPGWMEELVEGLTDRVYLTLDLDGLDPAAMPGTGTPEPGGLSYREALDLIRLLSQRKTVVSADVVELAAFPGSQVSEFTAARLVQKILLYCFSGF